MHHANDIFIFIVSQRAWNDIGRKVDPAHSGVLGIPRKGVEHKICGQFPSNCHISRYNSLATWTKLGGISHGSSTVWHSECTVCDCRGIGKHVQTCSEGQRRIYSIVIPARCHPSKWGKDQSTLASFAWMTASRDDHAVYPLLDCRTCLYIPMTHSATAKSTFQMSCHATVMPTVVLLRNVVSCGELWWVWRSKW